MGFENWDKGKSKLNATRSAIQTIEKENVRRIVTPLILLNRVRTRGDNV